MIAKRVGFYNGTSVVEGILEVSHILNSDNYPVGEEYFLTLDTGQKIQLKVNELIGFKVLMRDI